MRETRYGIGPSDLDGVSYTPKFPKRTGRWAICYHLRARRQPLGSSDGHTAVKRLYDALME